MYIKQILVATHHQTTSACPLTWMVFEMGGMMNKTCWRSKDELISDVLLWTPTHGYSNVG